MYKNNMKDINKIIIVGAGHSGVQAAASLREKQYQGEITIIEKETHIPYQKPPLSKKFLLDKKNTASLLRSDEWYKKNNINLLNNKNVIQIDRNKKIILVQKNKKYPYDKLILATGSRNRNLDTLNFENTKNVINLRSLNNSIHLKILLSKSNDLIIVGAGFIGLEVASIARKLNKKVTIVEAGNRVMPRNVSKDLSDWYIDYHKKKGVKFLFNEKVISTEQMKDKILSLTTQSKKILRADCFLTAIGSLPETSLAEQIGLEIKNGICVNEYMQTNDPDIYAIGDCTSFVNNKMYLRLESIQNAVDQSKVAASNILSIKEKYFPTPWFWSDQFDLKLQIVGIISDNLKNRIIKILGSIEQSEFSNLIFDNDKLVSIESINRPAHHMLFKNRFKDWHLIKPDMIKPDMDIKLFLKNLTE